METDQLLATSGPIAISTVTQERCRGWQTMTIAFLVREDPEDDHGAQRRAAGVRSSGRIASFHVKGKVRRNLINDECMHNYAVYDLITLEEFNADRGFLIQSAKVCLIQLSGPRIRDRTFLAINVTQMQILDNPRRKEDLHQLPCNWGSKGHCHRCTSQLDPNSVWVIAELLSGGTGWDAAGLVARWEGDGNWRRAGISVGGHFDTSNLRGRLEPSQLVYAGISCHASSKCSRHLSLTSH